ncbi:MAG: hypothetical protein AUI47_05545 [Acidobacteria bacterium 13_1_40CM_2_68_5]|nr:MAG: hypothetical protein AUI47_05545 [Acidobacteria bacterium 13_1_40CM_2_68_5]
MRPEVVWKRYGSSIVFGLIVLFAWELGCRFFSVRPSLLPAPTAVARRFLEESDLLGQNVLPTLSQTVLGFLLSVVVGILCGWVIVKSEIMSDTLYPLIVIFQVLPKETLAPILMLWFGAGVLPRLLLAFLIAFFPMVINTVVGLRSVDRDMHRFTRSLSCSPWQLFFKVEVPWALPYLFAGMKISATLAVIGVVVAELVAGRSGLGYLLLFASSKLDMAFTFAILAVLAAIGLLLFGDIALAERKLIYWKT